MIARRNNSLGVTESQTGSYVQLQFLVYMKTNQYHVHKTLALSNSTKLNSLLSNSQQNFKFIFLGLKAITFNQSHLWIEYPALLSEKLDKSLFHETTPLCTKEYMIMNSIPGK